ncbi:Protein of unknown function [Geoalkalibacter ferrihydriticus]|uniref:DUF2589 domain-containing protein n=2 Tax=Geoalkalibacter ferrihydriticus TaxID=392333 RepID=A0A0C2HM21_9BACT|nr:DUF2589 domain-containing protein [Geoalkalibacter ferrihydriticus]KIH76030.1 hypothetical protein GFER_12250 [Geoalkalibacter ferrihydriticus DSM 17813]SDM48962.1 Protein of unknown function [Geoalkalibacter ferrihydriticus]
MANGSQDTATRQLGNIPFGALIGGPMTAAVEAQAKAAQSSLGFIEGVAFDDQGKVRDVTFDYEGPGGPQTLTVPILTIVPIPFIRIDDMTINFKASINASTETSTTTSTSKEGKVALAGSAKYLFFSAKLDASYSSKKDSSATKNSKYSVEYTMDINVHAVQDDVPAGMAKVLNILTDNIKAGQQGSP